MSTYIFMKILESAPSRYDKGIRLLIGGKIERAYDRLASYIEDGQRVLDIGCGTGALALRAAQRGAFVKGIDINPQMLEIAGQKAAKAGLAGRVELAETGVAELDAEPPDAYDAVMSGLCFSELTADELGFALREARRILRPGGFLLVADEVKSQSVLLRAVNGTLRFFPAIVTYVITQTTSRTVKNLPEKAEEAGFVIESARLNRLQNFIELVCSKPREAA